MAEGHYNSCPEKCVDLGNMGVELMGVDYQLQFQWNI